MSQRVQSIKNGILFIHIKELIQLFMKCLLYTKQDVIETLFPRNTETF